MAQANIEPGTSRSRVLRSAAVPHWLGSVEDHEYVFFGKCDEELLRNYFKLLAIREKINEMAASRP